MSEAVNNRVLDYRTGAPPLEALRPATPEPVFGGFALSTWLKIIAVSVLMAATYRFNLVRLWLKTNPFTGEPNWRHAVCVPLIGIYYLFVHREELDRSPKRTAWSGLALLLGGILLFVYGIWPGQNDYIKDMGMIVSLFGVVTLLCGWAVMRIAWFPILFLVCCIPWPELVYSRVASPLQALAAKVAVVVLRVTGVDADNKGTKIIMIGKGGAIRMLNVAEACAGLRSLMTFISVAAAVAFLSARPLWQKVIVTVSAVPIAIFCNVMRVSGQGLLDHYWSQELSEGFAHQFVGIVMLVPGFFLILLVGWLLDKIFVEEVDEDLVSQAALAGRKSKAPGGAANGSLNGAPTVLKRAAQPAPIRAVPPVSRVANHPGATGGRPARIPANASAPETTSTRMNPTQNARSAATPSKPATISPATKAVHGAHPLHRGPRIQPTNGGPVTPAPSPFPLAVRKVAGQRSFVVAFVVLLTSALTLNAATSYLKLFFKKLPIEPAQKLDSVHLKLGGTDDEPHWVCVSKDESLPADIAEQLGTEQFVFRDYLNVQTPELRAAANRLLLKNGRELKIGLEDVRQQHPEAIINFAVTYYTGKADTVPHIPDRCYVADGYEPSQWEIQKWAVHTPTAPEFVPVRFITFEDQAGTGQVTRNVAYFFNCNGSYTSEPTEVRLKLQNLFEKYGYFAKVEIMTQLKDRDVAAKAMQQFLADVLPDVEKTLPDWNHRPR